MSYANISAEKRQRDTSVLFAVDLTIQKVLDIVDKFLKIQTTALYATPKAHSPSFRDRSGVHESYNLTNDKSPFDSQKIQERVSEVRFL